jgi:lysophospholipase L1-like esterase
VSRRLRRTRWCVLVAACCALVAGCPDRDEPAEELPASIGAMGDSITAALNVASGALGENPDRSWATGSEVRSHHERISERLGFPVEAANVAVGGARMADAPRQARALVEAGAEHVVLMLGANDACVPQPPPADRLADQLREALRTLTDGLPDTSVYVVSVPDITNLPAAFGDDPQARAVWEQFGICPNILGAGVSPDQLASERRRIAEYNTAIAAVCGEFEACHDDGGAVFTHEFGPQEVSDADFFHPSAEGQRVLAEVTWQAGPFEDG